MCLLSFPASGRQLRRRWRVIVGRQPIVGPREHVGRTHLVVSARRHAAPTPRAPRQITAQGEVARRGAAL